MWLLNQESSSNILFDTEESPFEDYASELDPLSNSMQVCDYTEIWPLPRPPLFVQSQNIQQQDSQQDISQSVSQQIQKDMQVEYTSEKTLENSNYQNSGQQNVYQALEQSQQADNKQKQSQLKHLKSFKTSQKDSVPQKKLKLKLKLKKKDKNDQQFILGSCLQDKLEVDRERIIKPNLNKDTKNTNMYGRVASKALVGGANMQIQDVIQNITNTNTALQSQQSLEVYVHTAQTSKQGQVQQEYYMDIQQSPKRVEIKNQGSSSLHSKPLHTQQQSQDVATFLQNEIIAKNSPQDKISLVQKQVFTPNAQILNSISSTPKFTISSSNSKNQNFQIHQSISKNLVNTQHSLKIEIKKETKSLVPTEQGSSSSNAGIQGETRLASIQDQTSKLDNTLDKKQQSKAKCIRQNKVKQRKALCTLSISQESKQSFQVKQQNIQLQAGQMSMKKDQEVSQKQLQQNQELKVLAKQQQQNQLELYIATRDKDKQLVYPSKQIDDLHTSDKILKINKVTSTAKLPIHTQNNQKAITASSVQCNSGNNIRNKDDNNKIYQVVKIQNSASVQNSIVDRSIKRSRGTQSNSQNINSTVPKQSQASKPQNIVEQQVVQNQQVPQKRLNGELGNQQNRLQNLGVRKVARNSVNQQSQEYGLIQQRSGSELPYELGVQSGLTTVRGFFKRLYKGPPKYKFYNNDKMEVFNQARQNKRQLNSMLDLEGQYKDNLEGHRTILEQSVQKVIKTVVDMSCQWLEYGKLHDSKQEYYEQVYQIIKAYYDKLFKDLPTQLSIMFLGLKIILNMLLSYTLQQSKDFISKELSALSTDTYKMLDQTSKTTQEILAQQVQNLKNQYQKSATNPVGKETPDSNQSTNSFHQFQQAIQKTPPNHSHAVISGATPQSNLSQNVKKNVQSNVLLKNKQDVEGQEVVQHNTAQATNNVKALQHTSDIKGQRQDAINSHQTSVNKRNVGVQQTEVTAMNMGYLKRVQVSLDLVKIEQRIKPFDAQSRESLSMFSLRAMEDGDDNLINAYMYIQMCLNNPQDLAQIENFLYKALSELDQYHNKVSIDDMQT